MSAVPEELVLCIDLKTSGIMHFIRDYSIVMAPDVLKSSLYSRLKIILHCPLLDLPYSSIILLTTKVPDYWVILSCSKQNFEGPFSFSKSRVWIFWIVYLTVWHH